jgi:uncharacterized protein YukE
MKGGSGLNEIDNKYVKQILGQLQGDLHNVKKEYNDFMEDKINDYVGFVTEEDFALKYKELHTRLAIISGKAEYTIRNWEGDTTTEKGEIVKRVDEIINRITNDINEARTQIHKKLNATFKHTISQKYSSDIESIESHMKDFKLYFDTNLNSEHTKKYFKEILNKKYDELMNECKEFEDWFKEFYSVASEKYTRYMNVYKEIRDTYAEVRDKIQKMNSNSRNISTRGRNRPGPNTRRRNRPGANTRRRNTRGRNTNLPVAPTLTRS